MFVLKKHQATIDKYNDDAMQYCVDVLSGKLLAGKLIKEACQRHILDLERKNAPFYYNMDRAKGMLAFAELIPDVSSGERFPLAGFQKFILSEIEGWRDKDTDGARFKQSLISMARTNGKTQLCAILAIRDFLMGTPATSRQVVVASNTMDQIRQLYGYIRLAWHALAKTKWFKGIAKSVSDNSIEMRINGQNTRLVKLTADGIGADSVHPTLAIFDEWHLQKTTDFIDTLSSGNVQNPDARLIFISTAGTDPKVPMREDYTRYSELLGKGKLDDNVLFLCWEQDSDEEAFKPETWIKSNPLMEIPIMKRNLTKGNINERNSQVSSGNLPKFLVKNMNRWQNAKKNAFIPLKSIEKAIVDEFSFDKRDVYIGYDASLSNDDTALVFVFPTTDGEFFIYQHSWIPTRVAGGIEAKMKQDGINYQAAEREGYATITQSRFGTVDQSEVYHWMLNFVDKHQLHVRAVGYDSWGTGAFIRSLDELKNDWLLFPIRQGAHSLSEPTKFLQDNFEAGKFTMFNDRVMKAALSNAVLTDKNNQLLIDKNINSAKIDIVDAIIDALYQGQFHFTDFTNEKEDKGNSPFAGMSNDQVNDYFKNDFSF